MGGRGLCIFCNKKVPMHKGRSVSRFSSVPPSPLGLQFLMNMESYSRQSYGMVHTPYNLGITQKNNQVDQKTSMFKVMPGHHISIYVQPKIVDASDEFKSLPLFTRNCKLPQETQGFNFLNEYSRKGCELECAAQKAVSFCKCLPWYYPNNFTVLPMCDMFGSHCFDRIMSDQSFYKKCQNWCKEECQEISLTTWATIFPLGTNQN